MLIKRNAKGWYGVRAVTWALTFWLALAGGPANVFAAEGSPWIDAEVLSTRSEGLGAWAGHVNHTAEIRDANIYCGTPYTIEYRVCTDKSHNGKVGPLYDGGYIGMPGPSGANWYYQGFLQIAINGRDIGTTPISSMVVAENDRRAIVDMVWHDEAADLRLRFLVLPYHDNLFTEISLDPKQEINSVQLTLKCYPSGFPSYENRVGARRIKTPSVLLKPEPERWETVSAGDNWWCVYYDEIYDVANRQGDGPCGLLVLPEEVKEFSLLVGGYMMQTNLTYPAGTRRIRLALWDFTGRTNADVLERMKVRAPVIRRELAAMDFTPEAVKKTDLAALRADLQRAAVLPILQKSFGPRIAEAQTALDQYTVWLADHALIKGIEAEERLLQMLDKCRAIIPQIQLAELLEKL